MNRTQLVALADEVEMDEEVEVIRPNSRPQEEFLAATQYEVFFGGAAGAGKTMVLVLEPLQHVTIPKFTAILFRRTFPELERFILPLTWEIYPHFGGLYHVQSKTWRFPTKGVRISLGFMQYEDDWRNYMGLNTTMHGYDELTNFIEEQYVNLAPWCRTRCSVPPYRRSTSNPGGPGHSFVKKRFVDTCPAVKIGEPIWSEEAHMMWQPMGSGPQYVWEDQETKKTRTRKFIPSRVFDNKDLLRLNPDYLTDLLAQPKERRRALLEGDWSVFEGQFFQELSESIHFIKPVRPYPGVNIGGAIDYGEKCAVEIAFRDHEGNIIFFAESYTVGLPPQERANRLADLLLERKLYNIQLLYDTDMEINYKNYSGNELIPIKIFRDVLFQRMGNLMPYLMKVSKASTDHMGYRAMCNEAVRSLLYYRDEDTENGGKRRVGPRMFITHECPKLWESMTSLVHDKENPTGMDFVQKARTFDHPYDACKYFVVSTHTPVRMSAQTPADKWIEQIRRNSTSTGSYWMPGMG